MFNNCARTNDMHNHRQQQTLWITTTATAEVASYASSLLLFPDRHDTQCEDGLDVELMEVYNNNQSVSVITSCLPHGTNLILSQHIMTYLHHAQVTTLGGLHETG